MRRRGLSIGFLSVLGYAHKLVGEQIQPGDCAIDATVGNGNDTLLLARYVGVSGLVYGFDIQPHALDRTRDRFLREEVGTANVVLIEESHDRMEMHLPRDRHGHVAAVMFNLGYLPEGRREIITAARTTIPALEAALRLLRPGGIITVVIYPGHDGGDEEAEAVKHWSGQLRQELYQVISYQFLNRRNNPSYLIALCKR